MTTKTDKTKDGIETVVATQADNKFDPAKFRLSQDFQDNLGVKQALLTVPVRKPDKQWFVRTHPDEAYRISVAVIEMKEDRETYLVDPRLCEALASEITPKLLVTTINRAGVVFLWPIRNVGKEGRQDEWSRTARIAAGEAKDHWVRMTANMSLGAYEIYKAGDKLPEPEWPESDFTELLQTAFQGKVIDTLDHDIVRKLRGEI
jgi:hypothetical protein